MPRVVLRSWWCFSGCCGWRFGTRPWMQPHKCAGVRFGVPVVSACDAGLGGGWGVGRQRGPGRLHAGGGTGWAGWAGWVDQEAHPQMVQTLSRAGVCGSMR